MLKSYDDLRSVDVSKWTEDRDGAEYLNWAKCVDLLHENGAEKVEFRPIANEKAGTSLFMTEQEFTDKNGIINRCYETEIEITVDDDVWRFRGPVMNGENPVKDNSMSQQRLWNCQCRLFVKAIALRKGLGFDLWLKDELKSEKDNWINNWDNIQPFFKYGPETRKIMYTTNAIESLNNCYKKLNRGRRVFPTQQALEKSMYLSTKIITEKWTSRYSNWGVTLAELHTYSPDRVAIN